MQAGGTQSTRRFRGPGSKAGSVRDSISGFFCAARSVTLLEGGDLRHELSDAVGQCRQLTPRVCGRTGVLGRLDQFGFQGNQGLVQVCQKLL